MTNDAVPSDSPVAALKHLPYSLSILDLFIFVLFLGVRSALKGHRFKDVVSAHRDVSVDMMFL